MTQTHHTRLATPALLLPGAGGTRFIAGEAARMGATIRAAGIRAD